MSVPKKVVSASPLAQVKALESDPELISLCDKYLPPNYDFEIAKTVWRIRKTPNCRTVALQMPEGLLIFATKIAEVLTSFTGVDTILMGDVTYGACCVDDFTASLLGAQLLVHYGHSCLVPTSVANRLDTIYVFVTIKFNLDSCVEAVSSLIQKERGELVQKSRGLAGRRIQYEQDQDQEAKVKVSLVSTIQFANSLPLVKEQLEKGGSVVVNVPRSKPLSAGEILGCTAPKVDDDVIIYVGDGRFHLEAMMMANPRIPAFRYDPYNRTLTEEGFDHEALAASRQSSVLPLLTSKKRLRIGVIQGTLGRQGNPKPVEYVFSKLSEKHDCFVILMSEVVPAKLALFKDVDLWVQFACPRLSIDWGNAFSTPILTPYEAMWGTRNCGGGVSEAEPSDCSCKSEPEYKGHPMDYYAYDSLGPHTPNFMPPKPKATKVS